MNFIYRTRIAGIIIRDGRLLLLKGKGYDELRTPGGKVDDGESDEMCLARELEEELGVKMETAVFFKEYTNPSPFNPDTIMTIQKTYIATISGDIVPAAEIEAFVRMSKEEFEENKYPILTVTREIIIPDLISAGIF